jgi:hypothetical protein
VATNILVMGESGTGKSTSLRTLNPEETFIINVLNKPLPFAEYKKHYMPLKGGEGNYKASDNADYIQQLLLAIGKNCPQFKNIVIDDFQYIMSNEYMRRAKEKGYDKFTEIGQNAWSILQTCIGLPAHINCYILSHTEATENGIVKIKTIGKMLDKTITLEGLFTIVLHSVVVEGEYKFLTQHDGIHIAKAPIGLFNETLIDNDLQAVNEAINRYFGDINA